MLHDFITLSRLEWKRGKVSAIQWMGLIGFDAKGSRLYRLYFWLFWFFWLFAMWNFVLEQVYQFSLTLPARMVSGVFAGIPVLIFVLHLLYLVTVLREEPLKLTDASLAYVAFSSVNRASIVLLGFVRALLLPAVLIAMISCLLTMLLTWHSAPDVIGAVGLAAFTAAIFLVYFSAALAWALALWKTRLELRQLWWIFWLALPVSILAAVLAPEVILFPGHIWQRVANLVFSPLDAVGFLMALGAALACLIVIGNRVHMSVIADASQIYARIQRLGFFGRWYATDLINEIAQENRLAHAKRPSFTLSIEAVGYRVLWNRALIALRRLLPGSILQPFALGSGLTLMITTIVRIGGWRAIQSWVLVLLVLCVFRLKNITLLFRQDLTRPFLRQMLPVNNLKLFLADAAYIMLITALGSVTAILFQPWDTPPAVILLGVLGVTALGLSQALELVEERLVLHRRIPFEYSVVVGGGVVIALGLVLHSVWAAVGGLLFINALLSIFLYYSRLL